MKNLTSAEKQLPKENIYVIGKKTKSSEEQYKVALVRGITLKQREAMQRGGMADWKEKVETAHGDKYNRKRSLLFKPEDESKTNHKPYAWKKDNGDFLNGQDIEFWKDIPNK